MGGEEEELVTLSDLLGVGYGDECAAAEARSMAQFEEAIAVVNALGPHPVKRDDGTIEARSARPPPPVAEDEVEEEEKDETNTENDTTSESSETTRENLDPEAFAAENAAGAAAAADEAPRRFASLADASPFDDEFVFATTDRYLPTGAHASRFGNPAAAAPAARVPAHRRYAESVRSASGHLRFGQPVARYDSGADSSSVASDDSGDIDFAALSNVVELCADLPGKADESTVGPLPRKEARPGLSFNTALGKQFVAFDGGEPPPPAAGAAPRRLPGPLLSAAGPQPPITPAYPIMRPLDGSAPRKADAAKLRSFMAAFSTKV